jgi:hypothetical protein
LEIGEVVDEGDNDAFRDLALLEVKTRERVFETSEHLNPVRQGLNVGAGNQAKGLEVAKRAELAVIAPREKISPDVGHLADPFEQCGFARDVT